VAIWGNLGFGGGVLVKLFPEAQEAFDCAIGWEDVGAHDPFVLPGLVQGLQEALSQSVACVHQQQ
jgi:hypothetical protein